MVQLTLFVTGAKNRTLQNVGVYGTDIDLCMDCVASVRSEVARRSRGNIGAARPVIATLMSQNMFNIGPSRELSRGGPPLTKMCQKQYNQPKYPSSDEEMH